jgi:hypothetical protein
MSRASLLMCIVFIACAAGWAACEGATSADVGGDGDTDGDTDADTDTDSDSDSDTDSDSDSDSDGNDTDTCDVPKDEFGSVEECTETAPPDSFEPDVQWQWPGASGEVYSIVTPLVANLTDDDDSGRIDVCDTPDVVVVASSSYGAPGMTGHIYVLDGATGGLIYQFATAR